MRLGVFSHDHEVTAFFAPNNTMNFIQDTGFLFIAIYATIVPNEFEIFFYE